MRKSWNPESKRDRSFQDSRALQFQPELPQTLGDQDMFSVFITQDRYAERHNLQVKRTRVIGLCFAHIGFEYHRVPCRVPEGKTSVGPFGEIVTLP